MADMGTMRVAQMTTWPRLGLPEWPRWLHGQDWDYQSGPGGYMTKMGDYQSDQDGNLDNDRATRVAQMVTRPRWGLPELPRWLLGQDGDLRSGSYDYMANMETTRVAQ